MTLELRKSVSAFGSVVRRISLGLTLSIALIVGTTNSGFAEEVRYLIKLRSTADLQNKLQITTSLPTPGSVVQAGSVKYYRPKAALANVPKRVRHFRGESVSGVVNPLRFSLVAVVDGAVVSAADIAQQLGPQNVEYVEIDPPLTLFEASATPSDDLFARQWHLLNDGQEYIGIERVAGIENDMLVPFSGKPNEDVGLRAHYANRRPIRKRPLIAVIDTGVDDEHAELQNHIWRNPDEIPDIGIDDDHNGYVDDTRGWDVSGDTLVISGFLADNEPTDIVGHGSHVSGIIAAGENGFGVVGVCPQAEIMPVKIFPNGFGSVGAEAVIYAVNNGADIINISWGTEFRSRFLDEAFAYAVANDVFVAVASGNSSDNSRFQPADIEELFTVGATNSDGYVTTFSTYGSHVDIVAPGQDILSIRGVGTDMFADGGEPFIRIVGGEYYLADGTSMATPIVAGAAGFLLSVHPELSAEQIAQALRAGARDVVQPFDTGASYPGVDSLSGWGSVDIDGSLALLGSSTLYLMEPRDFTRKVDDFAVSGVAVDGYSGGWRLEFGIGPDPHVDSFVVLSSGLQAPLDSTFFVYTDTLPGGLVTLRLMDDHGDATRSRVYVSRPALAKISDPVDGDTLQGIAQIRGMAHAHDFDSLHLVLARVSDGFDEVVYRTTGEQYGSVINTIELGARESGEYSVILDMFSESGVLSDSVSVTIQSFLHQGFPVNLGGFVAISPVAADLNGDGAKELVVGTRSGVHAYHSDGSKVAGFPVNTELDCRSVPALHDVDFDGKLDVIFTSDSGLHVVNGSGVALSGWPQANPTGQVFLGFPTPQPVMLTPENGEAIVFVNSTGQLRAFKYDGGSYFHSLGGLFTRIDPNLSNDYLFLGLSIPQVAAFDYQNDGRPEIMAAYSSPGAVSGLFLVNGRDGQPVEWRPSAQALRVKASHGMALGDVDNDGYTDALLSGEDMDGNMTLWLRTNGEIDLPGWPIKIDNVTDWIGGYPILADIDSDDIPEVIAVYTEFDISKIFVFKLNGDPFRETIGLDYGELLRVDESLSSISVADLDGDGSAELVTRSGFVFPGSGFEKLHAFTVEGAELAGFPIVTTAQPAFVTSFGFVPLIDDLDNDGLVEIALVGAGGLLHVWDMSGSWNEKRWDWPRLMHDRLNSSHGGSVTLGQSSGHSQVDGLGEQE